MKILISSHAFAPSIGGIETVSALLADEFVRLGHSVAVVTQTAATSRESHGYRVLRRLSAQELFNTIKWCDLYWQNNLSLRTIWPAWPLRKPVVITHQGSYCRRPSGIDFVQRLKHAIVGRTTSVAISKAVAVCFATDSRVIHNPYDARKFSADVPNEKRSADLVFLGRLVVEKGVDILLEALAVLRRRNFLPSLTIVGAGPEDGALKRMAATLGLNDQVTFTGPKRDEELIALLRRHKVLVVPSRYEEPFGVVALEGIASGCVVVGSQGGGLPEAIGSCGVTFPNGDVEALAEVLESLLREPTKREQLLAPAPLHLAKFHSATIAEEYIELFRSKLT